MNQEAVTKVMRLTNLYASFLEYGVSCCTEKLFGKISRNNGSSRAALIGKGHFKNAPAVEWWRSFVRPVHILEPRQ